MSSKRCAYCGGSMVTVRVDAKFCTQKCGTYYRRKLRKLRVLRPFPDRFMGEKRFVCALGKVPMRACGGNASSTNPATWSSFDEVMSSRVGDGFGVMLGNGLGCYDFDHCVSDGEPSEAVQLMINQIPEPILFAEVSVSGQGLHVFVQAAESPGLVRPGVERYTRERFIRMTGQPFYIH